MAASEVAQLLARIEQEYQAAQWALTGLASGTARHDFINTKLARVDEAQEQLSRLVGKQEAITTIATTIWSSQEQEMNVHAYQQKEEPSHE